MITAWTKHLRDEDAKLEFQQYVRGSKQLLERLHSLLVERESTLDRSETDIRVFDQPNWAERQAFKNGQRAELNALKKLINLDQQENT